MGKKNKAQKKNKILIVALPPAEHSPNIVQQFAAAWAEVNSTGFFAITHTEYNRQAPTYRLHSQAGSEFAHRMKGAIKGLNELSDISQRVGHPGMAMMYGVQAFQAASNLGKHNNPTHMSDATALLDATTKKLRTTALVVFQSHQQTPIAAQAAKVLDMLKQKPYRLPVRAFDELQRELTARHATEHSDLLVAVVAAGQVAERPITSKQTRQMSQQATGPLASFQPDSAPN